MENEKYDCLLTNPSFEVWYLMHFRYSTKQYVSSAEVVKELRKYVKDYEKNSSMVERLEPMREQAVTRAIRAEAYHTAAGRERWERNSGTEAYKVVKRLVGGKTKS